MNRRAFLIGGLSCIAISTEVAKANHKKVSNHKKYEHHQIKHVHHYPKFTYHKKINVKLSKYDKNVLIKTIWGETRGEHKLGRIAVVHVILNRIYTDNKEFKSYKNIAQVCLKKYQFSCWLDKFTMHHIKNDETYKDVKKDVEEAIKLYEHGIDYSNGAVLYYSDIIKPPKWASSYKQVNKIGLHNFFA